MNPIKVGISQIKNSVDINENFNSIKRSLKAFQSTEADIILFPECSLSGFSASIKECTLDFIQGYLKEIEDFAVEYKKTIILPTALKEEVIYNTGYIFSESGVERFYKIGLTESEKNFFSLPKDSSKKVFKINGIRVAILICFEAQMNHDEFFKREDVDLILWPGYWGWEKGDLWAANKSDGEENLIYSNMQKWRKPLIQANFSFNDLSDHRSSGPHGLSMFIDSNNSQYASAGYNEEGCYQISIEDNSIRDFKVIETFS